MRVKVLFGSTIATKSCSGTEKKKNDNNLALQSRTRWICHFRLRNTESAPRSRSHPCTSSSRHSLRGTLRDEQMEVDHVRDALM